MYSLGKTAVLALAVAATSHGLKATILADTNRDGRIDNADVDGKATWTEQRGALFLPNIVDTDRRCSQKITPNTTENDLAKCHDASDNILRNPKYLAPLRTMPSSNLSSSATATITLSGKYALEKVRIFHKNGGNNWTYIDDKHVFRGDALRTGLELGIDARDVRRPDEWDGRVTVSFNLSDNEKTASDQVALRVAPILIHHHLQEPDQVFTVAGMGSPAQAQFAAFIANFSAKAGVNKPVYMFEDNVAAPDVWAQDYFEPGYASIPGPQGPVYLRVNIRSSQPRRSYGRKVFTELRSGSVGAVQYFSRTNTLNSTAPPEVPYTIDSMGNLETIPPYSYNGKNYTAGRAIMGRQENKPPTMMAFLKAQEAQHPIDDLDHDWLDVGHTDEYMQFLPANNSRGWFMAVDDPTWGLRLLKKAQADGHGKTQAMSRKHTSYDVGPCLPSNDIDSVLGLPDFEKVNQHCADRIKYNMDIIKRETGIADEDIVRIPGVYYYHEKGFDCLRNATGGIVTRRAARAHSMNIIEAAGGGGSRLHRRQEGNQGVLSLYPGTINGLVYANRQYMAPNPWGPIIDGEDILAKAVSEAYAKVGFDVTFMDDWFDHHVIMGETHCGSNVARDASQKWW